MHSLQQPVAAARRPRSPIRPSLPTTLATLSNSWASPLFRSAMSLKASAISPSMPVRSDGRRAEKSPLRNARNVLRSSLGSSCEMAVSTCDIRPPVTLFQAYSRPDPHMPTSQKLLCSSSDGIRPGVTLFKGSEFLASRKFFTRELLLSNYDRKQPLHRKSLLPRFIETHCPGTWVALS